MWIETQQRQYNVAQELAKDREWAQVPPIITTLIKQFRSHGAKGFKEGKLLYATAKLALAAGRQTNQEDWGEEMKNMAYNTLRDSNNTRWFKHMEKVIPGCVSPAGVGAADAAATIRDLCI
jgi:hypothetical protein